MIEIPLFPLNTVLFPGMPLALHIFEDRYKVMIGKCIQDRQPFGVVLIRQGFEALGPPAEPHKIGCTAFVNQVERLDQGRLNIAAIGHKRFRVVSLNRELPYLVGSVEHYPLVSQDPAAQAAAARQLRPWILRYMDTLSNIEGIELSSQQLPDEPIALAYLAATLVQVPARQKQHLLAVEGAVTLLEEMRTLYRHEVAFVKAMLEQQVKDQGVFSLN